jgi:SAM-dependent methyltransferase
MAALAPSQYGGYISKSSLTGVALSEPLKFLAPLQDAFLKDCGALIPSEYARKWPLDKLHWWSRPQEYAFALSHILSNLEVNGTKQRVLEFGPGCSFMPYAAHVLAGLKNLCIDDIDEDVVSFWKRAGARFGLSIQVSKDLADKRGHFDLIYSVSVVEHTGSPTNTVRSLIDQLAPDGTLVLTMDVGTSNSGRYGLTAEQLREIVDTDAMAYDVVPVKVAVLHPSDIASPKSGWWVDGRQVGGRGRWDPRLTRMAKSMRKLWKCRAHGNDNPEEICVLKLVGRKLK